MAKPFHFKLEKVLEYRRQVEDQARMAVAAAERALATQTAVVEDLRQKLLEHDRTGAERKGEFTAHDLWLHRLYEQRLEQDLTEAREVQARLALKLQNCRNEAVQRSTERKLLEKLKEKQAKRHTLHEELTEQKEFDETSALRHEHKTF
jgi:flagellar FliJ protein